MSAPALHADALRTLTGWAAPTPGQERLRAAYVDLLRARPDALSRRCRPDHLTASTLVLSADGGRALLTLHAKAGRWFQLGGHCEPSDATLAGAAAREVAEESGLAGVRLDPVPVHLDAHEVPFCGGQPGTRHLDVRFVAVAPAGARPVASEESADVRWWPVETPPTDERSLLDLLDLGRARVALG